MNKRILILCTGNSCRSQMAVGFLKSFDANLEVFSAGTKPTLQVNPNAIKVMNELGIDIGKNKPAEVAIYLNRSFDYVITVCDNARETCPIFVGKVGENLHIGFEDPADATGTEEEALAIFRNVRDEIKTDFYKFYIEKIARQ